MQLVTREVAEETINKWLDYKRVKPAKREGLEPQIEAMVDAIMDGTLSLDEETFELSLELAFGVGEKEAIKTLTISPRMSVGKVQTYLKGVKSGDGDGRVKAYVSAMTGQIGGVIGQVDTEDYGLLSAIAVFFF